MAYSQKANKTPLVKKFLLTVSGRKGKLRFFWDMRGTSVREQITIYSNSVVTQGNKISSKKCKMQIQNISFLVHKGLLIVFRTPRSIPYTDLQAMFKAVQKTFSHKKCNLVLYTAQFKTPPQVTIRLTLPLQYWCLSQNWCLLTLS